MPSAFLSRHELFIVKALLAHPESDPPLSVSRLKLAARKDKIMPELFDNAYISLRQRRWLSEEDLTHPLGDKLRVVSLSNKAKAALSDPSMQLYCSRLPREAVDLIVVGLFGVLFIAFVIVWLFSKISVEMLCLIIVGYLMCLVFLRLGALAHRMITRLISYRLPPLL